MAILLKCSSRAHTLRLNPKRFWKTTLCPQCKVAVDPSRLRRAVKLPSLLIDKDFEVFPPFIKRTVIPILGLIALVVGVSLTIINWRKTVSPNSTIDSAILATSSKSQEPSPANVSTSGTDPSKNANTPQAGSPGNPPAPPVPVNTSTSFVRSDSNSLEVSLPSPTPVPQTVRYPTGTNLIRPSKEGGRAWLRISNGTNSDAIAKLVDNATNQTCRLVYIQAGAVTTISSIGSGHYTLKFSLGSGYIEESGKFLDSQSFSKFDETLDSTVSRAGNKLEWMNHEVTLNPVPGGTARTSSISATDFEDH